MALDQGADGDRKSMMATAEYNGIASAYLSTRGGGGRGVWRYRSSGHLQSAHSLEGMSFGFSPGINQSREVTYQIRDALGQPKHTLIL